MLLRQFLEEKKITQEQFSKIIGITRSAVNQYCSGKRKPLPNVMEKIIEMTYGEVLPNDFYNIKGQSSFLKVSKNTSGKTGNKRTHVQSVQKFAKKTPKNPPITPLVISNLNQLINQ